MANRNSSSSDMSARCGRVGLGGAKGGEGGAARARTEDARPLEKVPGPGGVAGGRRPTFPLPKVSEAE